MLLWLRTSRVLGVELDGCVMSNVRAVNGESVRMRKEIVVPLLKVLVHKYSQILWGITS
jgi:hypothetical protein